MTESFLHKPLGRRRFVGVSYNKRQRKWIAYGGDGHGGMVTIGRFESEDDAAKARDNWVADTGFRRTRRNFTARPECPAGCVLIELTMGMFSVVDADDHERVSSWRWSAVRSNRGGWYAKRRGADGRMVKLHREICAAPDGVEVDHVNGDTLDNRKSNLRLCSREQNQRNASSSRNKSGYHGVCFDRRSGRWRGYVTSGGKQLWSRLFDSPEEASRARIAKALEVHGEFSVHHRARTGPRSSSSGGR